MSHFYDSAFEVAGPCAMFTRPDTGSTPISYPMPSYSAARAMFEAVARLKSAWIEPVRVEICRPIRYERYVTNYGGPLRKNLQCKKGASYQLVATILVDVRYRIYGKIIAKHSSRGKKYTRQKRRSGRKNHIEKLRNEFAQRLDKGQTFYTPFLGWKEFVPTYFGPLKEDTQRDTSVNELIPALLHSMWEHGQCKPTFVQNWEIVSGVMSYERRRPNNVE